MPDWCAPIHAALAQRSTPCTVFFRDDDAGWGDTQLFALLDCFARAAVPLDLAVIPAALSSALARRLLQRMQAGDPVGVHQHGYAHVNCERAGRKCEFGAARGRIAQHVDLKAGRAIMEVAFGLFADPIFTPPWNRCSADTAACLEALGYRALSRDVTAAPFDRPTLVELPVAVDWCKLRPPASPPPALAERIAACLVSSSRVGIMLHHAVMDETDLGLLDVLLKALRDHRGARCVPMRALLPADDPGDESAIAPGAHPSPALSYTGIA